MNEGGMTLIVKNVARLVTGFIGLFGIYITMKDFCKAIIDAHDTLTADKIPHSGTDCDFCDYREAAATIEK